MGARHSVDGLTQRAREAARYRVMANRHLMGVATAAYTKLYYYLGHHLGGTYMTSTWMGTPVLKFATDLWLYQELIAELRPDLIVETGTAFGGSALYLANLLDVVDHGQLVSVDITVQPGRPEHPRVTYLEGSSTDPQIVARVGEMAAGCERVIVILDSDHSAPHVLAEMEAYADLVTEGSWLIVEDGVVNGHPALPEFGAGPWEAVHQFLPNRPDFSIDRSCQRYLLTQNTDGYLRRRQVG